MKMLKSKDLDFLSVVKRESSRSDPDHAKKTMMVFIPTIALVAFVLISVFFQYQTIRLQLEIDDYDAKIMEIRTSDDYMLVQQGLKALTDSESYIQNSRKMLAVKNSFPVTDAETIAILQRNCPAGTEITRIEYTSQYAFLLIKGKTDQPEKVADYTANLRATGAYVQLREETYQKTEQGEPGSPYEFSMYVNMGPGKSILELEGMVEADDIQ